ncbi:MAG: ABC transporter permease [Bacteroidales bacterium]|nr:ABC transporter permease [Bacteroidales bacterium]
MSLVDLIKRSLVYYGKRNLFLVLGIAVSAAVITGVLIVGDSVEYSLKKIVDNRLGDVSQILKTGDRYVRMDLAEDLALENDIPVSPVLLLQGIASSEGGQKRVNQAQIIGIDNTFGITTGYPEFYSGLTGEEVIISRNLADRLDVTEGEEILLRIRKASLIPLNAPFVSDAENIVSIRVQVRKIAGDNQLGRFNLTISQTAPFNVFMSVTLLNEIMDLEGNANILLFGGAFEPDGRDLMQSIANEWSLADAGLHIRSNGDLNMLEVISHRVFIDTLISAKRPGDPGVLYPVITYFVNAIESGESKTPYSFVSTLPDQWLGRNEIIINEWLAEDLNASEGDTLELSYYIVGLLRDLREDSAQFIVKHVVPIKGLFADRTLMPNIPGLSDAGNCRDWETGVPVDLEAIRDKDEEYWDRLEGTPKAFISISRAAELWQNRFGTYTALRYDASETTGEEIDSILLSGISPQELGFTLEQVRDKGIEAAEGGVDFSQLFAGLSFFLIVAGLLLTALLFILNLENRREQLKMLSSVGISGRKIRFAILAEGMILALAGSLLGLLLAILYNKMVFLALNGVWKEIVRTEMMVVNIRISSLATGFILSLVVSFFVLLIPLNRTLKRNITLHQKHLQKGFSANASGFLRAGSILSGLAGLLLIGLQYAAGEVINPSIFFAAGSLILIAALTGTAYLLRRAGKPSRTFITLNLLSRRNALRNRSRSLSIIILFAIGTFLVISTGSNRKDLFRNAGDPSGGTGGFLYYAESTVPVLRNLNNKEVRADFGFEGDYRIIQLRRAGGDDASCLNLNRIVTPQILGVDPEALQGRFSFITSSSCLDEDSPWLSLNRELPGGVIPAVADETVIKWGLGLKVGDTLSYTNAGGGTMRLLLIGGLAPSIFQGSVLISNKHFIGNYPQSSGTNVFLVDGNPSDTALIVSELGRGLRDYGWNMSYAPGRLAEFNSITNTYLSIFMVMGAFGLLIGTIGLAVVLIRSILERREEIAILRATGTSRKRIRKLVFREYMMLLTVGVGAGFLSAVIATLPSFTSPNSEVSFLSIVWILVLLILNGWLWIFGISRNTIGKLSVHEALRND